MKTEEIRSEVEAIYAKFNLASQLQGELVVDTPLTGEKIACIGTESAETTKVLVHKAHAAQQKWKDVGIPVREEFLRFVGSRIAVHSGDLSRLIHYDSGKSVRESAAEVASIVGLIDGIIKAAAYEPLPTGARRSKEFTPLGVIAIISPFNFPLAIGMWTGVPALLAGNTVINKPSENASLTPILYEAIVETARQDFNVQKGRELVPADIFQVAVGKMEVGEALVADQRVAKVIFTGGIAGCEKVKKADRDAGRRYKALTEGGAANYVVFSNRHEGMTRGEYVRFIVGAIMKSFLPYAGQKCINTRQIVAHHDVMNAVIDEFKRQLDAFRMNWRTENAFTEENPFEFTPLVNRWAGERFAWALRQTVEQGGELIGGERIGDNEFSNAQYFLPAMAVFKGHVPLMNEEIFGPFILVVAYSGSIQSALAVAQKPNANLVNAYYGSDEVEIQTFIRNNTAGFALINPPLGTGLLPLYGLGFGGNGLSGQGESLPRDPLLPFVDPDAPIKRIVAFKLSSS